MAVGSFTYPAPLYLAVLAIVVGGREALLHTALALHISWDELWFDDEKLFYIPCLRPAPPMPCCGLMTRSSFTYPSINDMGRKRVVVGGREALLHTHRLSYNEMQPVVVGGREALLHTKGFRRLQVLHVVVGGREALLHTLFCANKTCTWLWFDDEKLFYIPCRPQSLLFATLWFDDEKLFYIPGFKNTGMIRRLWFDDEKLFYIPAPALQ